MQRTASGGWHPLGFFFIFFGELAERASYYGMRAILLLYMIEVLKFSDGSANEIMHLFIAACYFMPMLGGWLSDNFFGKYWTIVLFCVPYILGHVIVGIEQPITLVIALFLLALGSGVTKPNISPLMGLTYDQKRPGQEKLRSQAFLLFYFSVNVGAFLSQLGVPAVRSAVRDGKIPWFAPEQAYMVAFLTPAVLMVIAFAIFAAGKPFYAVEKTKGESRPPRDWAALGIQMLQLVGFYMFVFSIPFCAEGIRELWRREPLEMRNMIAIPALIVGGIVAVAPFLFARKVATGGDRSTDRTAQRKLLIRLGGLFAVVTFFWLIFDQAASTITLFARDHLDLKFMGWTFDPDQVQTLNPMFILILTPILAVLWWVYDVRPTTKMTIGFVLTGLCVAILAMGAASSLTTGQKVSFWWVILAYFSLTAGELLISPVGLELAFSAAPRELKGFVTALWLSAVGVGNVLVSQITRYYTPENADVYFWWNAGIMVPVFLTFLVVAYFFNRAERATA